METAAIVTTPPTARSRHLHDRMPVIVPPEAFDLWLDCAKVDAETAAALIAPAPDDLLEAYEISTAVNRVANDNPKVLERLPGGAEPAVTPQPEAKPARPQRAKPEKVKEDDGQGALFSTRFVKVRRRPLARTALPGALAGGCRARRRIGRGGSAPGRGR